jgi:hypothetical protein
MTRERRVLIAAVIAVVISFVVGAGRAGAQAAARNNASPLASEGTHKHRVSDSLVVTVVNGMGHPWLLFYEQGTARVPLGAVDGGSTTAVTVPHVQGDSVTLWAVSAAMGEQSMRVPSHPRTPVVWKF